MKNLQENIQQAIDKWNSGQVSGNGGNNLVGPAGPTVNPIN
jgi:hypothetical protein